MLIIGHKGAAGYAQENTIDSIREALKVGVWGIEIDVQTTKDDVVILHHDRTIKDKDNNYHIVSELRYTEIESIYKLVHNKNVATLQEACNEIKNHCKLIIELKYNPDFALIDRVVRSTLRSDEYIIASFDHLELADIKTSNPNLFTMALIEGYPIGLAESLEDCACDFVGLGFESVSQEQILALRKVGVPLIGWTVDIDVDAKLAKHFGLDGIISDFPGNVMRAFNAGS